MLCTMVLLRLHHDVDLAELKSGTLEQAGAARCLPTSSRSFFGRVGGFGDSYLLSLRFTFLSGRASSSMLASGTAFVGFRSGSMHRRALASL